MNATVNDLLDPSTLPAPRPADRAWRRLTTAANRGVLWFAVAGGLAALGKRGRRAGWRGVGSLAAASFLANGVLKPLVGRRRPDAERTALARRIGHQPWTSSFPSGHATSAAAFATAAAIEWPVTAAALGPLAASVGYSRVRVGVHYRSDVLVGAAVGVGVALLGRWWWPVRPHGPAATAPATAPALPGGQGLAVVLNAKSGSADGADQAIAALLPKAVLVHWNPDDELATTLDQAAARMAGGLRALGVAGGDGTVASVAEQALRRGLPLAAFPAGTLNHFAGALDLATHADTAKAVEAGTAGGVQVANLDGRVFLNTAGIGGYPDMVRLRDKLSHRLGKWPAAAVALQRVLRGQQPIELVINDRSIRVWVVFVGNGVYTPRGLAPSWREDLADGVLDVQFLRADRRFARTLGVLGSLVGLAERMHLIGTIQADRLTIRSVGGPIRTAHDGEVTPAVEEFVLELEPELLTAYHPAAN